MTQLQACIIKKLISSQDTKGHHIEHMQACNNHHILEKSPLLKYGLNILTAKDKIESYIMNLIISFLVPKKRIRPDQGSFVSPFPALNPVFSINYNIQIRVFINTKLPTFLKKIQGYLMYRINHQSIPNSIDAFSTTQGGFFNYPFAALRTTLF